MAKTYVGVADKYLPYVKSSGVKSSMLSTGTYYFATEVEDNRDTATSKLTFTVPCTVAKLGSEAIGMYTDNTGGQPSSVTTAGNWYVKVTGVSSDGYLIVDIYDSKPTGVAHKVKKMYVGVDGVAKKVKKAYMGVNGVARKIYTSGSLPRFFVFYPEQYSGNSLCYVKDNLPTDGFVEDTNGLCHFYDVLNITDAYFDTWCGCQFKGKLLLGTAIQDDGVGNSGSGILSVNDDVEWENSDNWTFTVLSNVDFAVYEIATNGGVCVAVSSNSETKPYHSIYYTVDGKTWNKTTTSIGERFATPYKLRYVNGKFYFMCGGGILTSGDGINWTSTTINGLSNEQYGQHVTDILYHNGYYYIVTKAALYQADDDSLDAIYRGDNLTTMAKVFDLSSVDNNYKAMGTLDVCNNHICCGAYCFSSNGINWTYRHAAGSTNSPILIEGGYTFYFDGFYYIFSGAISKDDGSYYHSKFYVTTDLNNIGTGYDLRAVNHILKI